MRIGDLTLRNLQMIRNLNQQLKSSTISSQRLSTGKRVNSASDDPAAILMINRFQAKVNESEIYQRTLDTGKSLISVMDNAMATMEEGALTLKELAVQYGNGTLSAEEKTAIEIQAKNIFDDIASTTTGTEFNNLNVFSTPSYTLQSSLGTLIVQTPRFKVQKVSEGVYNITDSEGTTLMNKSLTDILDSTYISEQLLSPIAAERSSLGATQNRIETRMNYESNYQLANKSALSTIQDTDIPKETIEYEKNQLLIQLNNQLIAAYTTDYKKQIGTLFDIEI